MFELHARRLRRAMVVFDASVVTLAFGLANYVGAAFDPALPRTPNLALAALVTPPWLLLIVAFGGYPSPRRATTGDLVRAVGRAVLVGLLGLLSLLLAGLLPWRIVTVLAFAALTLVGLIGVRLASLYWFRRALGRGQVSRNVLIVGSGGRAERVAGALLQRAAVPVQIVGCLDPDPLRVGLTVLGAHVLGTVDEITAVLKSHVVDEVIVAVPRSMLPATEKVVRACEEEGVKVSFLADLFDVKAARITLEGFTRAPLLVFEPVAQEEWKLAVKRALDLTLVLLALPALLPLLGLVALAIKLDSPGPVFFAQERVGLNKRRFRMLKFRTMIDGGDRLQAQLEHLNEAAGPIFKITNDPRITRVGRLLRRTSLDELPQLFHVVTGEMSLVGPRPMSVRDVSLFDRGIQRRRFSVKPGLTCLWQVSGRSDLPFSRWLELDLWYIDHWSLALDLKILLRTLPAVVRGTGAV
jgi:exopolysaccharide biosynthesis polyprenyl glycosylphosphotransferase